MKMEKIIKINLIQKTKNKKKKHKNDVFNLKNKKKWILKTKLKDNEKS